MAEEIPAAQGIVVGDETIRGRAEKFCREFSNGIARRAPVRGDEWYLDEGVVAFAGNKHWVWRAVDQVAKLLHIPRREKTPALDCRPFRDQALRPRPGSRTSGAPLASPDIRKPAASRRGRST
jgi:transposase-like protein